MSQVKFMIHDYIDLRSGLNLTTTFFPPSVCAGCWPWPSSSLSSLLVSAPDSSGSVLISTFLSSSSLLTSGDCSDPVKLASDSLEGGELEAGVSELWSKKWLGDETGRDIEEEECDSDEGGVREGRNGTGREEERRWALASMCRVCSLRRCCSIIRDWAGSAGTLIGDTLGSSASFSPSRLSIVKDFFFVWVSSELGGEELGDSEWWRIEGGDRGCGWQLIGGGGYCGNEGGGRNGSGGGCIIGGGGSACSGSGGYGTGGGAGAGEDAIILVRFVIALSSASSSSFSSPSSLNLFLLLSREPFSNIWMALGWSVQ